MRQIVVHWAKAIGPIAIALATGLVFLGGMQARVHQLEIRISNCEELLRAYSNAKPRP